MGRSVTRSAELSRIMGIPRRLWESEDIGELTAKLTQYLKTPSGKMELRQIQAVALKECYEVGGILGPIPVGEGKSLISFLAPVLCEKKRPLLLIPAKLKGKTERELKNYSEHFKTHPNLKIMSYELLSRERGQKEFLEFAPDMIIADESHRLKNTKAACTKRVMRWMKENPDTVHIALSGTITSKSIMDYAHYLRWALKDNAPIPSGWRETKEWSLALDENLPFEWERFLPGALMFLGTKDEQQQYHNCMGGSLQLARQVYGRRLTETPGVVAVKNTKSIGSSLYIETKLFQQPDIVRDHMKVLRETWQTPDGVDIMEAPVFWMYARQYACGFYYKWTKQPPKEWLTARKAWASFVRKVIVNNRRGLDTQQDVANAVLRGEYEDVPEYDNWRAIRDSFDEAKEAVWLSDSLVNYCSEWMKENEGIVWVEHIAFGDRLAELTGLPFYHSGNDKRAAWLHDEHGPREYDTVILSHEAFGEGFNLQRKWSKNLIASIKPNAKILEQTIGRTHRQGQTADEVTFDILMKCLEDWEGFHSIIDQSKYVVNSTQQTQKILSADIEYLDPSVINKLTKSSNAAWKK